MFARFMEGRHRGHGERGRRHGGERGEERAEFADRRRAGRHTPLGEDRGDRHGRGEGRGERGPRRGGGRGDRQRLFEHGDLRLVLLALVAEKPSHGYELIKAIEEKSSGLYVPSPGVIYPTLTLLEEQDFLQPLVSDKGRKSYQLTQTGQAELAAHQAVVDAIFARLARHEKHRSRGGNLAEGIEEGLHSLRSVLRSHFMRDDLSAEQIASINSTLLQAVANIEAELATPQSQPDAKPADE